jgi:sulfur transfer protein SufE
MAKTGRFNKKKIEKKFEEMKQRRRKYRDVKEQGKEAA